MVESDGRWMTFTEDFAKQISASLWLYLFVYIS
jgi:hypothetical protein